MILTKRKVMDWCAKVWLAFGTTFGVRPATVIGVAVGAVLFTGVVVYGTVSSFENRQSIRVVQEAFCNGQASLQDEENQRRCQDLLKRLLNNPNEENARKLKEIVNDTN